MSSNQARLWYKRRCVQHNSGVQPGQSSFLVTVEAWRTFFSEVKKSGSPHRRPFSGRKRIWFLHFVLLSRRLIYCSQNSVSHKTFLPFTFLFWTIVLSIEVHWPYQAPLAPTSLNQWPVLLFPHTLLTNCIQHNLYPWKYFYVNILLTILFFPMTTLSLFLDFPQIYDL